MLLNVDGALLQVRHQLDAAINHQTRAAFRCSFRSGRDHSKFQSSFVGSGGEIFFTSAKRPAILHRTALFGGSIRGERER